MYGLTLQPYISQVPSAYNLGDVLDSTDAILMTTSADFLRSEAMESSCSSAVICNRSLMFMLASQGLFLRGSCQLLCGHCR